MIDISVGGMHEKPNEARSDTLSGKKKQGKVTNFRR